MPRVERFEDLVAWQLARKLVGAVYRTSGSGAFARDFALRDQIRRAAISVMSNIAEGFERGSRAEFHRFVVIAKGSCAEVRSQLYAARDIGLLDDENFVQVQEMACEFARVLGGLRASLDMKRLEGERTTR